MSSGSGFPARLIMGYGMGAPRGSRRASRRTLPRVRAWMMRSGLAMAIAVLPTAPLAAQDWAGFVASSSRADDPIILQVMETGDLETSVAICAALGKRADPFVGAFVDSLLVDRRSLPHAELLLRVLIQSCFDPGLGDSAIAARVAANGAALDSLVERMSEWRDPQLVAALARLLPLMNGDGRLGTLAGIGKRLIARLESGDGALSPQETALAETFLDGVVKMHGSDLLPQCAAIGRLSSDPVLVAAARKAAKALATSL